MKKIPLFLNNIVVGDINIDEENLWFLEKAHGQGFKIWADIKMFGSGKVGHITINCQPKKETFLDKLKYGWKIFKKGLKNDKE